MFKIEFETGNAVFHDETARNEEYNDYVKSEEVIRILNKVIQMLNSGYREGTCMDYNGHRVGSWKLEVGLGITVEGFPNRKDGLMVKKVWKIENGIGHWMLYLDGEFKASCDDGELNETIREIESQIR